MSSSKGNGNKPGIGPISGSTATVDSGGSSVVQGLGSNSAGVVGNNGTANGGASRKKSILKKSDSTMPKGSSLSGKMALAASSTADPELENLLVSDQESANNTPAVSRKTTQLHGTAGKDHGVRIYTILFHLKTILHNGHLCRELLACTRLYFHITVCRKARTTEISTL